MIYVQRMERPTKRKTRRNLLLKAEIRDGAAWSGVTICNVSEHGVMLKGAGLPQRGSFIEIRSNQTLLAGQVRWSGMGRCGVLVRETIDVEALIGDGSTLSLQLASARAGETRNRQGRAFHFPCSRTLGKVIDLVLTAGIVAFVGLAITASVAGALGDPMRRIESRLAK